MRLEKLVFSLDDVMMNNIMESFGEFVSLLLKHGFPPPGVLPDQDADNFKFSLPGMIGAAMRLKGDPSCRSIVSKSSGIVLTSTEIFYPEKTPKIPKFYDGHFYHRQPRYDYIHLVDLWGSPRKVRTLSDDISRVKEIQGYQIGSSFRADV